MEQRGRGRPTDYSDALADEICERLVMRAVRLVALDADMPCEHTIYQWIRKHDYFAQKYDHARALRAYRRAEDVDGIVAEMRAGDLDHNQARVAIDAIKWQAGRENPKKFSDRLDLNHSGDVRVNLISYADAPNHNPESAA